MGTWQLLTQRLQENWSGDVTLPPYMGPDPKLRSDQKEGCMPRLRHTVKQTLAKLHEAEIPSQAFPHIRMLVPR